MPQPIGITFSPTPDQATMGKQNLSVAGGVPEAIQILSLHVPKFVGARPLAPEQLLNAPRSDRASSVVESVLRSMGLNTTGSSPAAAPLGMPGPGVGSAPSESQGLAQLLSNAVSSAPAGSSAPLPHITPGVQPGQDPNGLGLSRPTPGGSDALRQVDTTQLPRTSGWDYRG